MRKSGWGASAKKGSRNCKRKKNVLTCAERTFYLIQTLNIYHAIEKTFVYIR